MTPPQRLRLSLSPRRSAKSVKVLIDAGMFCLPDKQPPETIPSRAWLNHEPAPVALRSNALPSYAPLARFGSLIRSLHRHARAVCLALGDRAPWPSSG